MNTLNGCFLVNAQVCVFTAPLFSAFCALAAYLFVKEIRGQGAGLTAAAFMAMVPSYISRSVAGSFDNEGVAIFALVFVFYLYVKVRLPSPTQAAYALVTFPYCTDTSLTCPAQPFSDCGVMTCLAGALMNSVVQALNTGSLAWSSAAALAYLYMVSDGSCA